MAADDGGDLPRVAALPDNEEREREVYARFGLAMFHAQVFEEGLISFIVALVTAEHEQAGTRGGADAFNDLMDDLYGRTAGKLLVKLREQAGLEPRLEALLKEAIGVRNSLAHRWFRENSADFGSVEGMQRMVDDLDTSRATLQRASVQTYGLAAKVFMSLGITERDIERVRDDLMKQPGRGGS